MNPLDAFEASVATLIEPRLRNIGFRSASRLAFVRECSGLYQIVEFVTTSSGKARFGVRLGLSVPGMPNVHGEPSWGLPAGIADCQLRASLGRLVCGQNNLWSTALETVERQRQMRDVLRTILIHGLGWLSHVSEPSTLVRLLARASVRPPEASRPSRVPPSLVLGLVYEQRGDARQARIWYQRTLDAPRLLDLGLQRWLYDRLHNLPA